jgi:hypothetical protein
VDPSYPGAVDEIINLGDYWDGRHLRKNRQSIMEISDAITAVYQEAYDKLADIGVLYEKMSADLNQEKLQQLEEKLFEVIFTGRQPQSKHCFATALTNKGIINNCDELSKKYHKRYILKGQIGSGHHLLLEKIAHAAQKKGYDLEVFHHTLAPQNIQMLLLPDLNVAVISDEGLSEQKWQENDQIIKTDALANRKTDQAIINNDIQNVAKKINQAKEKHDKLEYYYRKAMDFEQVEEVGNSLLNRILAIASHKEK